MTENSDGVARRHDVNLEHVIGLHYNTETRTPHLQVPPIWLVAYVYDLRKFSHYMTAAFSPVHKCPNLIFMTWT